MQAAPLEALLELREREWDAFREFRNELGRYVRLHAEDADLKSIVEQARIQMDNELRPAAKRLEREVAGLVRQAAIKGLTAGAVAMGVLHGVELGLLASAAATLATATGEYMRESRRVPRNAAYFLWQADKRTRGRLK